MFKNVYSGVRRVALTLIFLVSISMNEFVEAAPLEEWCEKQWINNSASHVTPDGSLNGNALLKYWRTRQLMHSKHQKKRRLLQEPLRSSETNMATLYES